MFDWITKPNYLWTFLDSLCCALEFILAPILICALLVLLDFIKDKFNKLTVKIKGFFNKGDNNND